MAKGNWTDFFDIEFLARMERLHLAGKSALSLARAGTRRSGRMGDGLEFADHRPYAEGDDPRFIDWPYYARMEKLLLRLFHEHSEADVGILLDVSASMAPRTAPGSPNAGNLDKFNFARRVAAALAYIAMGGHERVTLLPLAETLGRPLRTGRNRRHVFALLDFLAELSPGGRTQLESCVDEFARQYRSISTVLLVSDLLDSGDQLGRSLDHLRLAGVSASVLHVYSPQDSAPQLAGAAVLESAEDGGRLAVHVTEELLASYRARWRDFQEACHRTCLGRGVPYVAARTDMPFDRMVLHALQQAGVLQSS